MDVNETLFDLFDSQSTSGRKVLLRCDKCKKYDYVHLDFRPTKLFIS